MRQGDKEREREGQQKRESSTASFADSKKKKKEWAIKNVYDTRSRQPPKKVASGMWHVAECVAYD